MRLGAAPRCKVLVLLALLLALALPAAAQQGPKPVMENVFYNVVWGSAAGAIAGASIAVIGSRDKTRPDRVRESAFEGATGGGLLGLGIGVYLVYAGITFDPAGATLFSVREASAPATATLAERRPYFELETASASSLQITGFKALLLDLKF